MIAGIGVDTTTISEIARLCSQLSDDALTHMFTASELDRARERPHFAEYLATRFAAKEAVFKALAPLGSGARFDLRVVETLNREDGSPFVNVGPALQELLEKLHVERLHISITTEGDLATAFVIAEY